MNERKEIGKKIKLGRIKKGITQEQLAKLIGATKATISRWENGVRVPAGDILLKLAKELDIIEDLIPEYKVSKKENKEEIKKIVREVLKEQTR